MLYFITNVVFHYQLWVKLYSIPLSDERVTRVTRMAYSPRLWLMAIGW